MVESEKVEEPKLGKKSRKRGHIKMRVINDLKSDTFAKEVQAAVEEDSTISINNYEWYKNTANEQRQERRIKEVVLDY